VQRRVADHFGIKNQETIWCMGETKIPILFVNSFRIMQNRTYYIKTGAHPEAACRVFAFQL